MFESLMLPHEIDKADFDAEEPQLRGRLIDAQFDLLESGDFPVILLLAGIDALGRSAAAKQLLSWMDPRHVRPYAAVRPSEEERDRPRMWRFWQALPRKGRVGIFLNSWYDGPTRDYFLGRIGRGRFRDRIEEIQRFEQLLAQEGALIIKAFFYLPKKQTAKEFRKLTKSSTAAWKLSDEETEFGKELVKRYDDAIELLEELIGVTSTAYAPWIPIASADSRYRDLTIGRTLADAIRGRLTGGAPAIAETGTSTLGSGSGPNILDSLNLGQALKRDDYRARLKEEQRRLTALTLGRKFEKRALVAVFEGNDAAGKGGGIRRVVQALDPRMTRVISIAAPSDEEKAQPYLWRFWREVPERGETVEHLLRILDVTPEQENRQGGMAGESGAPGTAEQPAAMAAAAPQPAEVETALDPSLVKQGEKVFKKCKTCHQVGDNAKHRVGPHLNKLFGRVAGSAKGFRYSKAMKTKGTDGLAWDAETLKAFLQAPRSYVPKSKMAFAGLKRQSDRDAVIAYLRSFGD